MILNNYWKWKYYCNMQQKDPSGGSTNGYLTNVIDITGEQARFGGQSKVTNPIAGAQNPPKAMLRAMKFNSDLSAIFNDGTGDLSPDMYSMSSISNISVSSFQYNNYSATSEGKTVFTINAVNNNVSSITIERVGILKKSVYFNSSGYSIVEGNNCLMMVVELSQPVAVNAGESFTITAEFVEI